jgi:hypothetical protein
MLCSTSESPQQRPGKRRAIAMCQLALSGSDHAPIVSPRRKFETLGIRQVLDKI